MPPRLCQVPNHFHGVQQYSCARSPHSVEFRKHSITLNREDPTDAQKRAEPLGTAPTAAWRTGAGFPTPSEAPPPGPRRAARRMLEASLSGRALLIPSASRYLSARAAPLRRAHVSSTRAPDTAGVLPGGGRRPVQSGSAYPNQPR